MPYRAYARACALRMDDDPDGAPFFEWLAGTGLAISTLKTFLSRM